MIRFSAILKRFESKGEKTGWTYIEIDKIKADKINKGVKRVYRVKGKLDSITFSALALMPMGDGNFILPVKAELRKKLGKSEGKKVDVEIELDKHVDLSSAELLACLQEEPLAKAFFNSLTLSHQNYFSNYINSAKTVITKEKRILESILALEQSKKFDEMLRERKNKNA